MATKPIKADANPRTGFSALFNGETPEETASQPKAEKPTNEVRVTHQMDAELHKKIKIMANFEFTTLKDIINTALQKTVAEYEETHGELVKVPKSKK